MHFHCGLIEYQAAMYSTMHMVALWSSSGPLPLLYKYIMGPSLSVTDSTECVCLSSQLVRLALFILTYSLTYSFF